MWDKISGKLSAVNLDPIAVAMFLIVLNVSVVKNKMLVHKIKKQVPSK